MTSQEKRCSDHSFETSKVIVFLAGVKAKGSQCKWQRIQGVLAHLFFLFVKVRAKLTKQILTKPNQPNQAKTKPDQT